MEGSSGKGQHIDPLRWMWSLRLLVATFLVPLVGGLAAAGLCEAFRVTGHMVGVGYMIVTGSACATVLSMATVIVSIRELRSLESGDLRRAESWFVLALSSMILLFAGAILLFLLSLMSGA